MRNPITAFKEAFQNRGSASHVGIKMVVLVIMVIILIGMIFLILQETVFAADAITVVTNTAKVAGENILSKLV